MRQCLSQGGQALSTGFNFPEIKGFWRAGPKSANVQSKISFWIVPDYKLVIVELHKELVKQKAAGALLGLN